MATFVELDRVSKRYSGSPSPILRDISLSVTRGATLGLLGQSGCGKTTLLRLVAGFEQPTSGRILIGGQLVADTTAAVPPERRGVGVVFQETALLPHLTVRQNIAFGLHRWSDRQRQARIDEMLELLGIADVQRSYPHQVSGGEAQRTAVARALAPRPGVLLLDEPFNNLDSLFKWRLLSDLRAIVHGTETTAIFVTHEREEAFTVADSIAILYAGQIQQVDRAEVLYTAPVNEYVARYLGTTNLVPVVATRGSWMSPLGPVNGLTPIATPRGPMVSIRPAALQVHPSPDHSPARGGADSGTNDAAVEATAAARRPAAVAGTVVAERFLGEVRELEIAVSDATTVTSLIAHVPPISRYEAGTRVSVTLKARA